MRLPSWSAFAAACKSAVVLAAFDLDGTLVDQVSAARAWTREFVKAWDLPEQAVDVIASRLSERRPKGPLFDEIVREWEVPLDGNAVATAYRQRMPQLVRCADADKEALVRLRTAGWTIGIVTNGTVLNQEGKIRATGLAKLVDGWVVSEAVGARKPEAAIFEALAQRLNCELRGWMIGDGLEHDISGGAGVGLKTAWIGAPEVLTAAGPRPTICAPTVAWAVTEILSAERAVPRSA